MPLLVEPGSRRGGEFAAFFDGLEALRARVEDPLARRKRLDVDFAGLREGVTRHISRFEIFRPLLWAFFQGLLRSGEQLLAEMLLTVLIGSLPAAARRGAAGLDAACRFVANGALELHSAGAPGVANRVVLHGLARLRAALADPAAAAADTAGAPDEAAPVPAAAPAASPPPVLGPPSGEVPIEPLSDPALAAETPATAILLARRAWPALLHQVFATLPVERDRVLLGYVRRVLEEGTRAGADQPDLQPVLADLWARVLDRALGGVTPGTRSPALDHLLVRLARLLDGPGAPPPAATRALLERICALQRFTAWWAGWVERQASAATATEELPPSLRGVGLLALRTAAEGEQPAAAARRLRALATVCGPAQIPDLVAPLASDQPALRRAAVEALVRLHERLGADPAVRTGVVRSVLPRLDDAEPDVRRSAIRALGAIPEPSLVGPLAALYQRSPDSDQLQRAEVLDALVRIAASRPGAVAAAHRPYLTAERDRHAVMARGPLRDRILAALEKLVA